MLESRSPNTKESHHVKLYNYLPKRNKYSLTNLSCWQFFRVVPGGRTPQFLSSHTTPTPSSWFVSNLPPLVGYSLLTWVKESRPLRTSFAAAQRVRRSTRGLQVGRASRTHARWRGWLRVQAERARWYDVTDQTHQPPGRRFRHVRRWATRQAARWEVRHALPLAATHGEGRGLVGAVQDVWMNKNGSNSSDYCGFMAGRGGIAGNLYK